MANTLYPPKIYKKVIHLLNTRVHTKKYIQYVPKPGIPSSISDKFLISFESIQRNNPSIRTGLYNIHIHVYCMYVLEIAEHDRKHRGGE